jgi:hypothetical protein
MPVFNMFQKKELEFMLQMHNGNLLWMEPLNLKTINFGGLDGMIKKIFLGMLNLEDGLFLIWNSILMTKLFVVLM